MATINGNKYYTKGYVKRVQTDRDKLWLSVIEDIKAEIKELKSACRFLGSEERANGLSEALDIIDRKVKKF